MNQGSKTRPVKLSRRSSRTTIIVSYSSHSDSSSHERLHFGNTTMICVEEPSRRSSGDTLVDLIFHRCDLKELGVLDIKLKKLFQHHGHPPE